MGTTEKVQLILLVIIAFLVILDFWLYSNDEKEDTISKIILARSYRDFVFLSFAWGVLAGHFFLGESSRIEGSGLSPALIAIGIIILLYVLGRILKWKGRIKPYHHLILLVVGVLYGHFFWSQAEDIEIIQTALDHVN